MAASFSSRQMDLKHSNTLTLGASAQRQINGLPSRYEDNKAAYEKFIADFGTHYIARGKWGGVMMMYMETSSEYSEYFGGNWNLMKTDGLSAWQPTISANPWLYSTELKRISDLIRDPLRKEAMEKAVMNYLMMTYLNVECKRAQVNKLPPTYEENIAGYERFVQDFGTHYISVGKWGGIMMMYLETNSSYSEKKTEQEVSAQAEATFNSVLTVKGGTSISNTEIDSEFTSSTRRHVSRKAAMEKAVMDYLMKTYLTVECKRMLGTLPSEMQSRPEVTKVMTDINYLVARRPMSQSSVDAVGKRTLDTVPRSLRHASGKQMILM
nr:hypothetical protein BaRGS_019609 [Batillaria attramentaria]